MRPITAAAARRIAIAAQGLHRPVGDRAITAGRLRRTVDRLGLLQIDSVNVLARAHYLPLFSRCGVYPTELLDREAWPSRRSARRYLEVWAHEASLVPITSEPLLRWRRREYEQGKWRSAAQMLHRTPGLVEDVCAVITERGPMTAGEIEQALAHTKGDGGWWGWSDTKVACEYLFAVGRLAAAGRRAFARQYDLIENVVPEPVLTTPTPEPADAKRELVDHAAAAHGIGTLADLADYYRLPRTDTRQALAELTEAGRVRPVTVAGWKDQAYLHVDAAMPRTATGAALLCPFDPLIWFRPRTERLFGFHYRIEIYTPAERRRYGYYVFPLLVGDGLVGRFDLKHDRSGGRLLVQSAWVEPDRDPQVVAAAARSELERMARWLGADSVVQRGTGNLAAELAGQGVQITAAE